MRWVAKILLGVTLVIMIVSNTLAQSPREQLQQMVEQLRGNPAEQALRERIIRLAQEITPAPAVPDSAIEFEGRAQFAFKSAKSEADYLAAAREYEKAVAAAPWVSGYYSDLCAIYEKANRLEDARVNCELYLLGVTDASQTMDGKRRLAGIKFGIEQANNISARLNQPMRTDVLGSTAGIHYFCFARYRPDEYYDSEHKQRVPARSEIWLVYDGVALRGAHVYWFNQAGLAVLNRTINPLVEIYSFTMKRDKSKPRRFYGEGIVNHSVYEISADEQTVNDSLRKGGDFSEGAEEISRTTCTRK